MQKKNERSFGTFVLVSLFTFSLLFSGCVSSKKEKPEEKPAETGIHQIDIPAEDFRKVIGWLNDKEILVHTGDGKTEELIRFDIFSGKMTTVYTEETILLYVGLSPDNKRILLQKAEDDQTTLTLLTMSGDVIQERDIDTHGYVTANWNPDDENLVFLSYHQEAESGEDIVVEKWNIEENTVVSMETPSLNVQWYSANLYVYIDFEGDETEEKGKLIVGDLRSDKKLEINHSLAAFFLHKDTFVTFASSDFSDGQLLLTHEYPFMVEQGFVTIPHVTLNDRLILPHLSQGKRNGTIFAVIPENTIKMEEETGSFQLAELDFSEQKVKKRMPLPDTAPLSVSENEEYCLYGWRYEYMLNLKENTLTPLLAEQG